MTSVIASPASREAAAAKPGVWETRGFDAFRVGTFGNAGQNLYVSRRGVLQRIFQYDITQNGYFDLLFCNSQDHYESTPSLVVGDPLGKAVRSWLPGRGVNAAVAADLTGNGRLDLVLGCGSDGVDVYQNAVVYYAGPDGYSERRMNFLPAPGCAAVAAGDFDGRGRAALAFAMRDAVRLFYAGPLGIEARRFVDLPLKARQLEAADLDGDGYAELIRRDDDGETWIHWGGPDGIAADRTTRLPRRGFTAAELSVRAKAQSEAEWLEEPDPRLQVAIVGGRQRVTLITGDAVRFYAVASDRVVRETLALPCPEAQAVAVGRLTDGPHDDLVVAARYAAGDGGERSRIYWGGPDGWRADRFTEFPTRRASDAVIADLDGDGRAELAISQSHTERSFSTESLVFGACAPDAVPEPLRFATEDARRVLLLPDVAGKTALCFVNHFSRSLVGADSVRLYLGGPDGYLADRHVDLDGGRCAVEGLYVDVNDDGYADLVVVNCAENALWLDPGSVVHHNGPGGFDPARRQVLPTRAAHGCCCADIDRDGCLDLIFTSFTDPFITIYRGGPDGFDTRNPTRIPLVHKGVTYDQPRWIYLVDLNNDGWLDLVIPQVKYDRSFILWGGPEGFSFDRCQELAVFRACSARAADLTGNGYADLIVGGHMPSPIHGAAMPPAGPHESFVYIYWNGPDGLSESNRTVLRADGVNSMAVADFNGDGRLDLFVGSYSNGRERDIDSFLYWNREGVGFRNEDVTPLRTHSVSGCLAVDLDGDGRPDLAVANHKVRGDHKGFSTIWWNGPDGFDPHRALHLPTDGPHGMTAIEPGNILTRGPEEYYTSVPHRVPEARRGAEVSWEGEIPPKTWVRARLRSAASEAALAKAAWGPWLEKGQETGLALASGHYVQYHLALGATLSLRTPRLTAVTVTFH